MRKKIYIILTICLISFSTVLFSNCGEADRAGSSSSGSSVTGTGK